MRAKRAISLVFMAAAILFLVAASSPLSVSTDKGTYRLGETVTLSIQGRPNTVYGVQVTDPTDALIAVKQVTTDSVGKASFSFTIPSQGRTGTYKVYVAGGGESTSTTFEVEAGAPAPPPSPPPGPTPETAAAAALSSAKSRLQLLLRVFLSLNSSLQPLGLESVILDVSRGIAEINATLREGEAKYAAGDFNAANSLASSALSRTNQLIRLAFERSVDALRGFSNKLRNSTSDSLVLALLDLTDDTLSEVSPSYVDDSLESIDLVSKILLAVRRLLDTIQLEERVEGLSSKLSEAEGKLNATLSRIKELEGLVDLLEGENTKLRRDLKESEDALSAARREIERFTAENQLLRSQNAELERQLTSAVSQANTATTIAVILLVLGLVAGFAGGYVLKARKRAN
ncbi:MAG: MG2 domain-containing protein [Thermofilaceae archaeon]|nr:MG2 domain-containing protein [Thermofilaceae archaeon]MCX8181129.1 MG2 domain-containing protein [Thermofilaceae archaeon]MDW8004865.1 MG2 domain-containing protein [Thermofilaceae archaeon]